MCNKYNCCYHRSMTPRKRRLTVTVDPELVEAGNRAVAEGAAESLSGWVTSALHDKVNRDRKLQQLGSAIADYESEFGEITREEIVARQRADRNDAIVVRGGSPQASGRARGARTAKSA